MADSQTADLLAQAVALQRRGALADAAARYAAVLRADPHNADAHYYLGMMACQQGRFAEGAEHARKSLSADAQHTRAHVLLGRALSALGRREDALGSFERAIALAPDLSQAHSHRADVLSDLGRHGEAIESYDRALALASERVEDWYNRAVALDAIHRRQEALASVDRAVAGKPESAQAHVFRAKLLSDLRRYDEALASAERAVALEPGLTEAWLGRGNIAAALANWDEARSAYDRALAVKPDFVQAWFGRGYVHLATGKPDLAIEAAIRALEISETAQAKRLFAQSLGFLKISADSGRLRGLVQRALSESWARPRALMNACISILKLDSNVSELVARSNSAWPVRLATKEWLGLPRLTALADDRLLGCILEAAPVTDIGLERLLTNVRRAMLTTGEAETPDERLLAFYCAVARQCFINEYVFSPTEAEAEQVQHLQASLEHALATGGRCPASWPVVAGAYFPLHTLTNRDALLERSWPQCVQALLEQQVKEPLEERRLAAIIPALTAIEGEVTRKVRRQYEENPYPRWAKAGPPALAPVLQERSPESLRDILIAGCGTGLVAIEIARQLPLARILAVDLSLASLGYAKRMAQRFSLKNLEFAQADIMELAAIDRRFDCIEASGVLHHMADPWEGWRALLSLLRPEGAMQIGLYSTTGRRNIAAARELIAHRGYRPTPDDIRRCREETMAAEEGSLLKSVTSSPDFFAMSGCRDLLFHVEERRTTLREIKLFLVANDLEFTGFVLPPPVLHQFTARFPDAAAVTDLDCWHAFEFAFPQTFAGMYQFGVRKPAGGTSSRGGIAGSARPA